MPLSSDHLFHELDPRRLLSAAAVSHGTLLVVGTDHADKVLVAYASPQADPRKGSAIAPYYKVTINNKVSKFAAQGIERIEVHARAGNDFVNLAGPDPLPFGAEVVDSLNAPVRIPSTMIGGRGDDTLYGGML